MLKIEKKVSERMYGYMRIRVKTVIWEFSKDTAVEIAGEGREG